MTTIDVLIVGAGPTGLALAAHLVALGCRPRIIDARTEAWRPSHALVVQPRTLELLRPLGVTAELVDRGRPLRGVTLHAGHRAVRLRLPDLDPSDTPYPSLLLLPQADVESVLQRPLAERGVDVEWGVRLTGCTGGSTDVVATVDDATIRTRYLVGCDGAESTVRTAAGIGVRGGSYRSAVTLADVELIDQPAEGLHVFVGRAGMAFISKVGEFAPWRMLATTPGGAGVPPEPLEMLAEAGIRVRPPGWSVELPQRYALADRYRRGRIFLAGDAAHVHSPGGGQGLNTGIGDASNLGWKLALAVRGLAGDALLDSYEAERRPLARLVLALTGLIYVGESSANPLVSLLRRYAPTLAGPLVEHLPAASRLVLRVIGQLWYGYRTGSAVREATPRLRHGPRAGRRAPDTRIETDAHPTTLHQATAVPGLHLVVSGWSASAQARLSGLWPGLLRVHRATTLADGRPGCGYVLIRPDGYVGLRGAGEDPVEVEQFLRSWR